MKHGNADQRTLFARRGSPPGISYQGPKVLHPKLERPPTKADYKIYHHIISGAETRSLNIRDCAVLLAFWQTANQKVKPARPQIGNVHWTLVYCPNMLLHGTFKGLNHVWFAVRATFTMLEHIFQGREAYCIVIHVDHI